MRSTVAIEPFGTTMTICCLLIDAPIAKPNSLCIYAFKAVISRGIFGFVRPKISASESVMLPSIQTAVYNTELCLSYQR